MNSRAISRLLIALVLLTGITHRSGYAETSGGELTKEQQAAAKATGITAESLAPLLEKPLYQFSEAEVDQYIRFLQAYEPELRRRIVHLARKSIGQPYELYLLGEMPFEHYDPQPIYCLEKSDCLTFSEHIYAMALADDWTSFMTLLQRIRYWDGKLGVATRNHYAEVHWNPSNRWLVTDMTRELGGEKVVAFRQKVDLAAFLKKRYKLLVDIPVEQHDDVYLPIEVLDLAKPHLQEGDFVNIVRGRLNPEAEGIHRVSAWVGHVGMIGLTTDESGQKQVNLIHSTNPQVREEPIDQYVSRSLENLAERKKAGKPILLGFKFLRIESDPLKKLKEIDGEDGPKVTLPKTGLTSVFEVESPSE